MRRTKNMVAKLNTYALTRYCVTGIIQQQVKGAWSEAPISMTVLATGPDQARERVRLWHEGVARGIDPFSLVQLPRNAYRVHTTSGRPV